jgi:hypothetical protein
VDVRGTALGIGWVLLASAACGGSAASTGSHPAVTQSASPTSTPTASQEAAATTAGVRSIALTARQLPGFHATDPADESTDHDAFTLCKRQSWASDGFRVAQYERQWLSAKQVLLDDIVLGYDSPPDARGAYNEFRGSAATCPAFTDSGTRVSFLHRPFAIPAGARASLAGDEGFLTEIKTVARGKTFIGVAAVLRRGSYVVVCTALGPSGDATSPIAGECAGLSQPALVAATH